MHPQIEALLRELDAASERAARLGVTADEERFQRRPSTGGWSAGECVAHLTMTTSSFLPGIDAALARGTAVPGEPKYRSGVLGGLLAWSLEPPVRVRFRTGASFVPQGTEPRDRVLAAFASSQQELRRRIEAGSGLDLNALRVRSVFDARMSYNPYAAYRILLAHQRRHLWQAERALQE